MRGQERALVWGLVLTGLGLAALALLCWQSRIWAGAVPLSASSWVNLVAAAHIRQAALEARREAIKAERAARPDDAAIESAASVALAAACCEMWWTSAGGEHDPECRTRAPWPVPPRCTCTFTTMCANCQANDAQEGQS